MDALKDLLERVEAGDDFLERDIQDAFGGYRESHSSRSAYRAYHGSLDAAKALHDAVLPDHRWEGYEGECWRVWKRGMTKPFAEGWHKTNPARAWLIAILKALIAERKQ